MSDYWRPIVMTDGARSAAAQSLAGGPCWFDRVERIERGRPGELVPVGSVPGPVLETLTGGRSDMLGLSMNAPRIMGILNVTPDSFSDGGKFDETRGAVQEAHAMIANGADILDIGGESTRPGAPQVATDEEISRVVPVIGQISDLAPVSIDTRKAAVAQAALASGAKMVNDVSALAFDTALGGLVAKQGVPICLMHAQGAPENMQDDPQYDDVLLDVYDGLNDSIDRAQDTGIERKNIIVDPGIGFGKTHEHNVTLLRGLSLFHGLGVPILLGASRKGFIGKITGEAQAGQRLAGSVSVALSAIGQGVQIVRVHDIKATRQAILMNAALIEQK